MLSIIILAAGQGTRMNSSTPKILHKIAGLELINHVIRETNKLDIVEIIIVKNTYLDLTNITGGIDLKFANQKYQLGTADAVKSAISKLSLKSEYVLVVCGDTPLITAQTLDNFYKDIQENNSDISIVAFEALNPSNYGRVITNDNKLIKIVEHKDANEEELKVNLCNSAITLIRRNILLELIGSIKNNNAQGEFYFTDIIAIASSKSFKCSYFIVSEEEVKGVNDRIQLAEAENIYQNRLRRKFMLQGSTLIDPTSVYFSYDTEIGQDVIINPNVYIGKQVIINNNVKIKSYSHIEGAVIKSDSIIGPFARIRASSVIAENSRIGNFVEIKNSQISSSTKINHLSYIGDSVIGKNTNIGAGVITCNYNGFDKNKTIIGDDIFIGSNSCLIAPVVINNNAIIAAGSIIDQNIEENALAISRSKLEIKSGKAIDYKKRKCKS